MTNYSNWGSARNQDYVHLDAQGNRVGYSTTADNYYGGFILWGMLIGLLWPATLWRVLRSRYSVEVVLIFFPLVLTTLYTLASGLLGFLYVSVLPTNVDTFWALIALHLWTSLFVWIFFGIPYVIFQVLKFSIKKLRVLMNWLRRG